MEQVAGHRLVENGGAFGSSRCRERTCLAYGPVRLRMEMDPAPEGGHGRCVCGAESPHVSSNRERRQWYDTHKMAVLSL